MSNLTKADFDGWRFNRDAVHFNGGSKFFGWGHRCVDQPRLLVIDKYFKKDRSTERSYLIDDRTACATLDEALAALSVPPAVNAEDLELLRAIPPGDDFQPEKRSHYAPLAAMGLVQWGRDKDDNVTCRLTDAGRKLLGD